MDGPRRRQHSARLAARELRHRQPRAIKAQRGEAVAGHHRPLPDPGQGGGGREPGPRASPIGGRAGLPGRSFALAPGIITFNGTFEGLGQTSRFGDVLVLVNRPQEAVYALQLLKLAFDEYFTTVAEYNRAAVRPVPRAGLPRVRDLPSSARPATSNPSRRPGPASYPRSDSDRRRLPADDPRVLLALSRGCLDRPPPRLWLGSLCVEMHWTDVQTHRFRRKGLPRCPGLRPPQSPLRSKHLTRTACRITSPGQARKPYTDLFFISFAILFLELACIRWFGSAVLFLTFFTNLVLFACFLGMSVGLLATSRQADSRDLDHPAGGRRRRPGRTHFLGLRPFRQPEHRRRRAGVPQQVFFGTEPRAVT